jgi:hypothetical protein
VAKTAKAATKRAGKRGKPPPGRVDRLFKTGLSRGVRGGRRGWLAVSVTIWLLRGFKRIVVKQEHVVAVERLDPGQHLTLTTIPPESRRDRKAARRAAKMEA